MPTKTKVPPIPKGYRTLTPYLLVKGAAKFIAFAQKALAAEVVRRSDGPNGLVMNAELRIGDSMLMCADPRPETASQPASFYLYVTDCDAWYERALKAGAEFARRAQTQRKG
jgi:uncharacterized glyoxalase superfamily protein PhnB